MIRSTRWGIPFILLAALQTYWCLPRPIELEVLGDPGEVRIIAAGDIILHLPIVNSVRKGQTQYDFRPILEPMAPIFQQGDIAVASLETVLAGKKNGGYTGYPRFNSPDELADALAWSGIDLVFTAHNHSLDRGERGALRTQEVLRQTEIAYVGTNISPDLESRLCIVNVNGARLAFLSYTFSTNGIPSPKGKEWIVQRFQGEQVKKDIALAKLRGAQAIICALHAGTEYRSLPDAMQKEAVNLLINHGVDLVLGSHPHVVQPLEWRARSESRGIGFGLVAYSLGNLLSNQRWRFSDCGLVLDLTLSSLPDQSGLSVTRFRPIPVWVHRYGSGRSLTYRVIPVPPGGEVGSDPLFTPADRRRLRQVWDDMQRIVGNMPLSRLEASGFGTLP